MYIHPAHRPLAALLRWVRRTVLALFSLVALQAGAQPTLKLLNNTVGEKELMFMGTKASLGTWYIYEEKDYHVVRVCHGTSNPVSLNLGEKSSLVLSYTTGIDTLTHRYSYQKALRSATFKLNDEQWERFKRKELVTATIVDGHGTLVRAITKDEAALLRQIAVEVDHIPAE